MIGRAPGRLGNHPLEPKRPKVQLLDEHVDHSDRVLLRHIVVQELGKQNALPAVLTFDEALHLQLPSGVVEILPQPAFSHSLGQTRKSRDVSVASASSLSSDFICFAQFFREVGDCVTSGQPLPGVKRDGLGPLIDGVSVSAMSYERT